MSDKKDDSLRPTGMLGFTIVWSGQLVSLLGSAMTNFALLIWIWQETGQATPFAVFGFSFTVPLIVASPLAGALVDRWDRKLTMALSDLAAGASTVIILILFITGDLQIWHLYFTGAFAGFFGAFQFPAFSAATTMMVSKNHYARASAMRSMAGTASGIFAPILAAALLAVIGIRGILIIDIITFSAAVGVLVLVYIPKPPVSEDGLDSIGSIWKESLYGFKYIYLRRSLFGLLLVFLVMNFTLSFSNVLRAPMILARSGNNEYILGGAQSAAAFGGLAGGLFLTIWGGPLKKIRGIFIGMFVLGVGTLMMGVSEGLIIWAVSGFVTVFAAIFANSSSQAFWQSKVAPDIQGKVFSARAMIANVAAPISMIVSGPLADTIFEPSMTDGGYLASIFGNFIGVETGSGMSVMFLFTGIAAVIVSILGYSIHEIRDAENIIPDHDAVESPD